MAYSESGSLDGALSPQRQPQALTTCQRLRRPLLLIASAAVVAAVVIEASVQLVDRPVATWVHAHLGDARFDWFAASYSGHPLKIGPFSLMAGPAQAVGPLAVLVVAVLAVAAASGWRPQMRGRIVLTLCLSVFAALTTNSVVKPIFGRTWPESWLGNNPSWIHDGVFGFFPFHGGAGWGSFPSGHTTVITTPAVILWIVWPELRILWVATVALVVAGLLGANYHFVSDVVGGLCLGTAIGLAIAKLLLRPMDRLNWSMLRTRAPPCSTK